MQIVPQGLEGMRAPVARVFWTWLLQELATGEASENRLGGEASHLRCLPWGGRVGGFRRGTARRRRRRKWEGAMGAFPFNVFCHFLMKCMPPSPYTPLPFVIVIKNKTKKQKNPQKHCNLPTWCKQKTTGKSVRLSNCLKEKKPTDRHAGTPHHPPRPPDSATGRCFKTLPLSTCSQPHSADERDSDSVCTHLPDFLDFTSLLADQRAALGGRHHQPQRHRGLWCRGHVLQVLQNVTEN